MVHHAEKAPEASRGGVSTQCRQRRSVRRRWQAPYEQLVDERFAHRPQLRGPETEQRQHRGQRGLLEAHIEGMDSSTLMARSH
jgi:hypothetical protein